MTPLKTMRRACIFSSFFFVCACVCLREGWLNLKKSSAKQRKLPCSCWLLTYYSAMRLALSKKQLANVAVVRCRTTHGIGKQIKGGAMFSGGLELVHYPQYPIKSQHASARSAYSYKKL